MNIADMLSYARRVFVKSGPPIQLTFFITSRCNLRCRHCFYWKALDSDHTEELSTSEIQKIAGSIPRLLVLSLTGGEPFVRKDIGEIYSIFAKKSRPHIITISTNGFYKDRMQETIPEMLKNHPATNMYIYLSLDGPEFINDKIRGPGAYKKAFETLRALQEYRKTYNNFGVSVSLTYNRINADYLCDFFKEISGFELADNINIGMVRGDPKDLDTKSIKLDKYKELAELKVNAVDSKELLYYKIFFKRIVAAKDHYTYKIVQEVMEHDRYVLPCSAGSLMGILYDNGDLYPCEILEDACLGNVRDFDYDIRKLWATKRAKDLRKKIVGEHCYCTFECAMSGNILFNPKYLTKSVVRAIVKR